MSPPTNAKIISSLIKHQISSSGPIVFQVHEAVMNEDGVNIISTTEVASYRTVLIKHYICMYYSQPTTNQKDSSKQLANVKYVDPT